MIKSAIGSLISLYVGGMYYFAIINVPILVRNKRNLKTNNPWTKLIKQILLWPVTMPQIMQHGNPVLEVVNDEQEC